MAQQLQTTYTNGEWKSSKLPAVLAGDIAAAGISASLISPLITAIDRYVQVVARTALNIDLCLTM
jgi:hypothetical protein